MSTTAQGEPEHQPPPQPSHPLQNTPHPLQTSLLSPQPLQPPTYGIEPSSQPLHEASQQPPYPTQPPYATQPTAHQYVGQHPPPMVVQQPILVDPRRGRTKPYLLRGAKLSNGWTVHGVFIIVLVTIGCIFIFMGLPMLFTVTGGGFFFVIVGGLGLGSGLYIWHLAKQQFNALPPDHPDRLKYGTGHILPIQTTNNVTTYAFPVAQQTGGYPTAAGEWQVVSYPGSYAVAGGSSTGYNPANDLPPSYSEVVKNQQNVPS